MLYVGLDYYKRYARVNAIVEKESHHSDIFKQNRNAALAARRQLVA